MNNIQKTVIRLEEAILSLSDDMDDAENQCELLAAAGEALGVIRTLQDFNPVRVMYDMARLAGHAGQTPEDFDEKAK